MFAPIMDFRALVGLGPRIAEHALDTVPLHAFPAWEDVRLKGQSVAVASQPPRPVSPAPSTPSRRDEPQGQAPLLGQGVSPAPSTPSRRDAAEEARSQMPRATRLLWSSSCWGRDTTAAARKVSGYRKMPNVIGFSVQSTPQNHPGTCRRRRVFDQASQCDHRWGTAKTRPVRWGEYQGSYLRTRTSLP